MAVSAHTTRPSSGQTRPRPGSRRRTMTSSSSSQRGAMAAGTIASGILVSCDKHWGHGAALLWEFVFLPRSCLPSFYPLLSRLVYRSAALAWTGSTGLFAEIDRPQRLCVIVTSGLGWRTECCNAEASEARVLASHQITTCHSSCLDKLVGAQCGGSRQVELCRGQRLDF